MHWDVVGCTWMYLAALHFHALSMSFHHRILGTIAPSKTQGPFDFHPNTHSFLVFQVVKYCNANMHKSANRKRFMLNWVILSYWVPNVVKRELRFCSSIFNSRAKLPAATWVRFELGIFLQHGKGPFLASKWFWRFGLLTSWNMSI